MEITIKSLNIGTFDNISEVFGEHWFNERHDFYEDGIEVCDASVNIEFVTAQPASDGVWLIGHGGLIYKLEREDFLEIIIY